MKIYLEKKLPFDFGKTFDDVQSRENFDIFELLLTTLLWTSKLLPPAWAVHVFCVDKKIRKNQKIK